MATTAAPARWTLNGNVIVACNCDYGCPCNFNAMPTMGHCEGGWTWHVEKGTVDDVVLDGLAFSIYAKWPGAIHHGNGEAVILVDERADAPQQSAIAALVTGKFGGPWGVLAWTWPTVHGPRPVPYELTVDGIRLHLKAGDAVELESTTIKNPVTGAEAHPGIVLPEGLILKQAELGASVCLRVTDEIAYEYAGKYTAVGRFAYAWP